MTTASDYTPPPRSLLWAKPYSGEEGQGIEMGCDCSAVTVYILEGIERMTEARDLAFTCDGCQSVRWVTVGPLDQLGQMEG